MTEVTIFENKNVPATHEPRKSMLGDLLGRSNFTSRRIQTNTNGTFKRLVNGEQIGSAVRGEIEVVVIGALKNVSRIYYKEKYDPNKEATLPNCWSNQGDVPDPSASDPQSEDCDSCTQNIKGSGQNNSRACRYQRRVAILLADDPSGDIYQFNIPAKSLFGKGSKNTHPFESYVRFLRANDEAVDTVITKISYNMDADSMELMFTPMRRVTDEEYAAVQQAQKKPEASMYTMLTVGQADNVVKLPAKKEKAEEGEIEEPAKRTRKKKAAAPEPDTDLAKTLEDWGSE